MRLISSIVMMMGFIGFLHAQSPVSGFMQGKGNGSIVLSYSTESYDEVFLVPNKIEDGVPVFNKVTINSVNLYATYGILDQLDVVLTAPYIRSTGDVNAAILDDLGFEDSRSGIQDVRLFVKYRPCEFEIGPGKLGLTAALGFTTPLGDYEVNEGLQSILAIGNGSTRLDGMGIAQYKLENGLFVAGQLGYSFRNNEVPNAFLSEVKLGYAGRAFYADAWLAYQNSNEGVDILQPGFVGFFPATEVDYTRAGISVYVPVANGFGVTAGASTYLNGRNLGAGTGVSGGIVFGF